MSEKLYLEKTKKRILEPDLRLMNDAYVFLMDNLAKPTPTIQELADRACMGTGKFRRLFQELYNDSVYHFHLNARMELAKKLLLSNEYTVTQIAYKVGFSHHQSFIKSFMNHTHLTPRQFQEQNKYHLTDTNQVVFNK